MWFDYKDVYNTEGKLIGRINRDLEYIPEDNVIWVKLPCGFEIDFWIQGLTDVEFIRRAEKIKELENEKGEP